MSPSPCPGNSTEGRPLSSVHRSEGAPGERLQPHGERNREFGSSPLGAALSSSSPPPNLLGWRERGPAHCRARLPHLLHSPFPWDLRSPREGVATAGEAGVLCNSTGVGDTEAPRFQSASRGGRRLRLLLGQLGPASAQSPSQTPGHSGLGRDGKTQGPRGFTAPHRPSQQSTLSCSRGLGQDELWARTKATLCANPATERRAAAPHAAAPTRS